MKNSRFISLLVLSSITSSAFGQTPTLGSISDWSKGASNSGSQVSEITESDRKEIGTFFLLHSMAEKGLIGKDAGICVNYVKGEEGMGDKISFGIKGNSDNVGESDCAALSEVQRSTPIIQQMGKFFSNGCEGKSDCMQVNVTGYSDGIRQAGESDPSKSVSFNDDLAKRRAGCYEAPISGAGLSKFGAFNSQGRSSRYGQYLDIMNKVYGGDANKFMSKLPKSDRDYFEPLYKKYGTKYNINCSKRRVTVMDFEFKSNNASLDQKPGASGPSLYSGGSKFNKAAFMDGAIQVAALTEEDLTQKSDKDLDSLMEKIMKGNGVTDLKVIESCKNDYSRKMLKYFSARIGEMSPSDRSEFYKKVKKGDHGKLLSSSIENPSGAEGSLYTIMTGYLGNEQYVNSEGVTIKKSGPNLKLLRSQPHPYPAITTDNGVTSTPLNCFGAKNAIKHMMGTDKERMAKACKPVGHNTQDGKLGVEFAPLGFAIGCSACGSGLHHDPLGNGLMTSKYDNRDVGFPNVGEGLRQDAAKKYPYSADELESFASELATFEVKIPTYETDRNFFTSGKVKNLRPNVQKCLDNLAVFKGKLNEMIESGTGKNPDKINLNDLRGTYNTIGVANTDCKRVFDSQLVMSESSKKLFQNLFNVSKPYINDFVEGTIRAKYSKKTDKTMAYFEEYDKLRNPQNHFENKILNVHGLLHDSDNNGSHMTVGGMKNPGYYILKNCDCSDPNLMDKVLAEGEYHAMDIMPHKAEVASSGDACIVSLPVPTSCMVDINNSSQDAKEGASDPKISWLDSDGNPVESILKPDLGDLKTKLNNLNSGFDFDNSCPSDDAIAKAEAVVRSLACDQNPDIQLPNPEDEFADCAR